MATQLNFAQQMDAVLKTLGDARPRLLLHACCGPCSSAVLEQLCQYFDITVLYYNPNTWPAEEYYRRGEELKKFVAAAHPLGVTVVEDAYDPQEFYTAVQGLEAEPERGGRCTVCYRLRMRRAAQYAAEHGFDWFTTTLSISPHKDAKRINAIGQELEAEFGVKHLPSDFKKHNGYLRSLQLSEEYGLYRQDRGAGLLAGAGTGQGHDRAAGAGEAGAQPERPPAHRTGKLPQSAHQQPRSRRAADFEPEREGRKGHRVPAGAGRAWRVRLGQIGLFVRRPALPGRVRREP